MEHNNEYLIDLLVRCHNGDKNAIKEYGKLRWKDLQKKITFDEVFIKKMYELSEKDNSYALNILGLMHHYGDGVTTDRVRTKELYEQAGEKGNGIALFNLAVMYYDGNDTEDDFIKAKKLFEQAVEKGVDTAICSLAVMYCNGHGTEQNFITAKELFEKAIEKGDVTALLHLGNMYYIGYDGKKDCVKTIELYEQAIKKGIDFAMIQLARVYSDDEDGTNDLKAIELYKKFIENNVDNHIALEELSSIYVTSDKYKNYIEAAKIYLNLKNKNKLKEIIIKIIHTNGTTDIPELMKLVYDPRIDELYGKKIPSAIKTLRKMNQYCQHEISKTILSCRKIPSEVINKEIIPKID